MKANITICQALSGKNPIVQIRLDSPEQEAIVDFIENENEINVTINTKEQKSGNVSEWKSIDLGSLNGAMFGQLIRYLQKLRQQIGSNEYFVYLYSSIQDERVLYITDSKNNDLRDELQHIQLYDPTDTVWLWNVAKRWNCDFFEVDTREIYQLWNVERNEDVTHKHQSLVR